MNILKRRSGNLIVLVIQIALTISICLGIAYNSYQEIHKQADNYAAAVEGDYDRLTNDYIRNFNVLKMESEEKIKEDLSFEEMQNWLLSRDEIYRNALGDDLFDGFAFTYKGGYVHSWNYGDYSEYVPASRPWYQLAESADGEVAVVAPYVTFLSNTDLIEDYDILRMSIVQKYNDEISFDFDLNVREINDLIVDQETLYSGTFAVLYDKDGYILSSTDDELYGHNINVPDSKVTEEESRIFSEPKTADSEVKMQVVNGKLQMVYHRYCEEHHTLCMMIPFTEVFLQKFLFVLCLALILIMIEITFYFQNKIHLNFLEKANNAKSDFLSRMSHELRTPLNALTGYTDLTEENILSETPDTKAQLQYLSHIRGASKYLLRIIDDILDMQNTKRRRTNLNLVPTNAEKYIGIIWDEISKEAKEKGIHFTVERLTKLSEFYMIDDIRCGKVIMNVLHNAVKFTPKGGSVHMTVEASDMEGSLKKIKVVVSDNGIGMSKEFVDKKLFTNFAQEDQSIESPYEGCGIGLALCKELLDMMGGTISCTSEKGKGSTFTIVINAEAVKVERKRRTERKEQPAYDLSGIRILLCEDNPMNQDMEKRILEKMKCEVAIAEDGKIGLIKFIQNAPGYYNMILMDIRMPNMDGLEATRKIRELSREDAKTVPILAVSANAFDEDIETSLNAGMNEHLAKPVSANILYEKIKQYCGVLD